MMTRDEKYDKIVNFEKECYKSVVETIQMQRFLFIKKFGVDPNYVKLPYWIYQGIIIAVENKFRIDLVAKLEKNDRYFMNLRMCPTIGIETIDEIEVF